MDRAGHARTGAAAQEPEEVPPPEPEAVEPEEEPDRWRTVLGLTFEL